MPRINNPAGRLLILLSKGKGFPPQTQSLDVWAELLQTPPDNIPLLLRRVGRVIELPSEIRDQVSAQPNIDPEVYLKWAPNVEQALSRINFYANWGNFNEHITDTTLYGLQICDDLLARIQPQGMPDEDQLSELQRELNELIEMALSANIEDDVKAFFLAHLRNLDDALLDYRISGILPIERAVHAFVGEAALKKNLREKTHATELGKRFWNFMGKTLIVLSILSNAYMLGDAAVQKLIPEATQIEQQLNIGDEEAEDTKSSEGTQGDSGDYDD